MNLTETSAGPVTTRRQLRVMTAVLVGKFDDLNAGTVLRSLARCRSQDLRSGSRVTLIARVEILARARLESHTDPSFVRQPNPSLA